MHIYTIRCMRCVLGCVPCVKVYIILYIYVYIFVYIHIDNLYVYICIYIDMYIINMQGKVYVCLEVCALCSGICLMCLSSMIRKMKTKKNYDMLSYVI